MIGGVIFIHWSWANLIILHFIVAAEYLKIFIKYMPNIKGAMFAADDNIIFFGTDSNIFILHKKNDLVIKRILYKLMGWLMR